MKITVDTNSIAFYAKVAIVNLIAYCIFTEIIIHYFNDTLDFISQIARKIHFLIKEKDFDFIFTFLLAISIQIIWDTKSNIIRICEEIFTKRNRIEAWRNIFINAGFPQIPQENIDEIVLYNDPFLYIENIKNNCNSTQKNIDNANFVLGYLTHARENSPLRWIFLKKRICEAISNYNKYYADRYVSS